MGSFNLFKVSWIWANSVFICFPLNYDWDCGVVWKNHPRSGAERTRVQILPFQLIIMGLEGFEPTTHVRDNCHDGFYPYSVKQSLLQSSVSLRSRSRKLIIS